MFGFSFLKLYNLKLNFNINLEGNETSTGFIKMTQKVMSDFGINLTYSKSNISIDNFVDTTGDYHVEGDATTASYLFAWAYINKFKLTIPNLNTYSCQPDINILFKMLKLFGTIEDKDDGLLFIP